MPVASRFSKSFLVLFVVAAGCSTDTPNDPPTPLSNPVVDRTWQYWVADANYNWIQLGPDHQQSEGVVDDKMTFGDLAIHPHGFAPTSASEVFSNETGETYYVSSIAPRASVNTPTIKGTSTVLYQESRYVIDSDNPKLTYTVSHIVLETIDADPSTPSAQACRQNPPIDFARCAPIRAAVGMRLSAHMSGATTDLVAKAGIVDLNGYSGSWQVGVRGADGASPLFSISDFTGAGGGADADFRLSNNVPIEIPLAGQKKGDTVVVNVKAMSTTSDSRQLETFSSAFLRDPVTPLGVSVDVQGLHLVPAPSAPTLAELDHALQPAPPCAGAQGNAGTLQFSAAQFETSEGEFPGATITITRTGGTSGVVSATVHTGAGTATPGADYESTAAVVRFADGESGAHTISIPIHGDASAEPDETVGLTLSDVGGCVTLGAQRTATLVIRDDDTPAPPPPTQFSIGGTLSGLIGSGLLLRERIAGFEARPTANGPFTIMPAQFDGSSYAVEIAAQPSNPLQVCTVANASGKVAGANVTNIAVSCSTPQATGSLDASFGTGGRVVAPMPLGATAIALQQDGKIVAVGNGKVERFDGDGSPDQSFGSSGQADFTFTGATDNLPQGVVIQPDGKIVVVGYAQRSTRDDFVVARYSASGALDAGFGTGGTVILDFGAVSARGWGVALQSDGAIVVAGQATKQQGALFDTDFAVARLTTTGALDATFGTNGKATCNVGGGADFAYAAKIQSDGRIVLTGRAAVDGGSNPDVGLARFTGTGVLDASFGTNGITKANLGMGDVPKEPFDFAIQSDGRIVVAGEAQVAGNFNALLARFTTTGALDATFGIGGVTTTSFTTQGDQANAIALQSDGKIVIAGRTALFGTSDFALARYTTDGALDVTFGTGGKVVVDFLSGVDAAQAIAIQADGKIVAAGSARNGNSIGLGMVRVVP